MHPGEDSVGCEKIFTGEAPEIAVKRIAIVLLAACVVVVLALLAAAAAGSNLPRDHSAGSQNSRRAGPVDAHHCRQAAALWSKSSL
ncbi:hypothetical protein [Streptomyces monashensis]|uniref:Uncharacterized protein n=1 Tax=Streptomyces monashensis TaxID=1678012 RepID=A0A1S2QS29_9ACTN|nr:hypothetical protein [Streptomyces monashensis]OIK08245.1 hypothetical protein BIV23_00455 [Streptomyces monashensis]